ncbi:transcriptional regulator ATRX-like [Teleopsis dalmanni]|uniref:transcriptional regulator ATRX-like n=1 Tax=Teleopsis dalmanni TaxID=139649 RepID=UPI0018CEAFF8|nr:transcriptional regulator ATRX-like [Teleopsis dalmanni]
MRVTGQLVLSSTFKNRLLAEFVLQGTDNSLVFSTESESIFEKIEKGSQLELEYESEDVMEESSSEETYLDNINDFDVVEVISCDTESDGEHNESHSLLPSTSNIGIKIEVSNIKTETIKEENENEFLSIDQEKEDFDSWNGDLDLSNVMNEHNYTTQNHTDKLNSSNNMADVQVNDFVEYIMDRINSFQTERNKELEKILTERRDLFVQSIMDAVDEEDRNEFGNYNSETSRKIVEKEHTKSPKVKTVEAGTNTIDTDKIDIDKKIQDPLPTTEVKPLGEDKYTETDGDYILEKLMETSKILESSKPVQCDKETQSEIISESPKINCSEPMEYLEAFDWNEPNEESLTEEESNLKKLATLAKNMYDRCISLKQEKEKDGFNVKDLIKEQFYKLKELAQYNFDNVEKSTQTEPNMSRRKLKKLKRKLLASSGSSSESSSDESMLDFIKENNTENIRKNHVHSSIEDFKRLDDYNDTSNLNITSSQKKKTNSYLSNESLNKEKQEVEPAERKDSQVSSKSNEKGAQETKKVDNKVDKNSEIEKLLNLDNIRKRPQQNLKTKPKKIKEKPLKSKSHVLDFLDNDLSKISVSDESNSEDDSEEKLTEKQYLVRYNEKLKNQFLNESSDDDEELDSTANDLLENLSNIDGGHSPLIDKFLETFNADSEFDEIDEDKVEEDNIDTDIAESNANKSEISVTSVKNTTPENNSDCELLNCSLPEEKRTQNKSLEKLIKEADRRKKLKKIDEDLISLSSDSSSLIDNVVEVEGTSRIIKPMLRQDQLAIETRKAQKRENERIRRLEKNKAIMEKAIKKREKSNKCSTDLILDYLEETDTFVKVHPEIVKNLKPHQIEGIKFMYDTVYGGIERNKKNSGSGCILAHCMGLGKTLQLIALLHTLISYKELQTRKILVLCPKSTVMNWDDELKRWLLRPLNAKNLKVFKFNDQSDICEKINIIKEWSETEYPKAGCLLLGYEAFRTLVFYHSYKKRSNYNPERLEEIKISIEKYLLQAGTDLVVCDEGHIIKNNKSATSLAVAKIITRKRIVLTGTPIQNNLKECTELNALLIYRQ